ALFGYGMTLLALRLFTGWPARLMVVGGALLSVVWIREIYLTLHVFALLPLVFHFLIRFVEQSCGRSFWLAVLIATLGLIGNLPYIAPIHLLIFSGFMAVMVWGRPGVMRVLLKPDGVTAGVMLVTLLAIAVEGWFALHSVDSFLLINARNPDGGGVPLGVFLDFGRPTLGTTLFGVLSGALSHADNVYYVGLLPLGLFVMGLFTIRHRGFWGFAVGVLILAWLSIGGMFATLMYSLFPGLKMVRLIGLMFGPAMLLLLVASGFVMDRLQALLTQERIRMQGLFHLPAMIFTILLIILMGLDVAAHRDVGEALEVAMAVTLDWQTPLVIRLIGYQLALVLIWYWMERGVGSAAARSQRVMVALLLAFALDMGSYQVHTQRTSPNYGSAARPSLFQSAPLPYLPQRMADPEVDSRAELAFAMLKQPLDYKNTVSAPSSYAFNHMDPCFPQDRSSLYIFSASVLEMLDAMFDGHFLNGGSRPLLRRDGVASLGCGTDKLRLIKRFRVADRVGEAKRLLHAIADLEREVVLHGLDSGLRSQAKALPSATESEVQGSVTVGDFSANRIALTVVNQEVQPVWLLYRDAYHPDWRAYVDGAPVGIAQANIGFKALLVAPGTHHVVWRYEHGLLGTLAHGVALLALLGGVGFLIFMGMGLLRPNLVGRRD
ncbi:MAG: hypothetical protein HQL53_08930, partial [Magnetococcales bacterium]|nr:hypothetical protein [Magnetococcales bacterium]